MLEVEVLNPIQFHGAIHGMRHPYKNTDKSDSYSEKLVNVDEELSRDLFVVGPKDANLALRLATSKQPSDGKFLRMIHVTADIKAPLYWWKEMDQYKVATTTDSESTMHTIEKYPFDISMFSIDTDPAGMGKGPEEEHWKYVIRYLNYCRDHYIDSNKKDKRMWRMLIQALPESYIQTRTWDGDYQTLRNIYFQRKDHKLEEWHQFCDWIESLPHSEWLTQIQI